MTTKEKLDMLWKYLALAVVAAGLILFSNMHLEDDDEHILIGVNDGDHTSASFGKAMDVRVEKEVTDGDTTLNVTVNGKPVDASTLKKQVRGLSGLQRMVKFTLLPWVTENLKVALGKWKYGLMKIMKMEKSRKK